MPASDIGIVEADFLNNALQDLGVTVTRTPKTKVISNITGSAEYVNGTPEDIIVVFVKRGIRYSWDKEGLTELGDAFLMIRQDQEMNKEDLIDYDGETYRVDNVLKRSANGTELFKTVILFKVD